MVGGGGGGLTWFQMLRHWPQTADLTSVRHIQVATVSDDAHAVHEVQARLDSLEADNGAVKTAVAELADNKADMTAVEMRLGACRAAIDDMRTSVLSRLGERAAARQADAAQLRDGLHRLATQAQAAESRIANAEEVAQGARQAALGAGDRAAKCRDAVLELRKAFDVLNVEVHGDTSSWIGRKPVPLLQRLQSVEQDMQRKVEGNAVESVRHLASQVLASCFPVLAGWNVIVMSIVSHIAHAREIVHVK
jgi:septal ring factor EnvC (AmiA/AmiB activator)